MKRWVLLFFLPCSIEYQIDSIRPKAQYILHSGDYAGIEWTDKLQVKPTLSEMDAALASCRALTLNPLIAAQSKITTDKSVLANAISTTDQKLNALIDLLNTNNTIPTATAVQVGP